MEQYTQMAQALLGTPGSFTARCLAAVGIAVATWLGARLVRAALLRLMNARGVDDKLQSPGFSASMATIAVGLVWLFALPALLGTLGLDGLLAPVNAMMSRLLGFVPNLMGAAVVLGVGVLVGQIIRQVVTGLLVAAGSERFAERLGLGSALGDKTLAGMLGGALFAFILLPTVAAAFQTLGLEVIAAPVSRLLEQVIALVPRLIAAALIVAITAVLGRALAQIVSALVAGLGINRLPAALGLGDRPSIGGTPVSDWVGRALMLAVVFVGITQASEVMGLPVLTSTVAVLGLLLARLAAALVVIGVGAWLATLAARAIAGGAWSQAPRIALGVRAAILFFAGALALHQAGLPAEIVSIAFAAVVGSLALGVTIGLAIAIGLGARPLAQRLFERSLGDRLPRATDPETPAP